MDNSLSKVFTLPRLLHTEGCCVVISAGALYKVNSADSKILLQLKFKNMGKKTVKAIKTEVQTFGISGDLIDEKLEFQYLDLTLTLNKEYTDRKGVFLKNQTIRSFNVKISEVIYDDGSVWTERGEVPQALPVPKRLSENLGDLAEQYKLEIGKAAKYEPFIYKDIWCCSCGEYNRSDETACHSCFANKEKQFNSLDKAFLTERKETFEESIRTERERQQELDRIKKERIKKITKKVAIITVSIICVITAFVAIYNEVIIPNTEYNKAVSLMEEGNYKEAIVAFKAMDGYKDSDEKIDECNAAMLEAKYNKAVALMDKGNYKEAIAAFKAMDGYKDSDEKIDECNAAMFEAKYNEAVALMDKGNYKEAIAAFKAMDGYKDSDEKIDECNAAMVKEPKKAKIGDYVYFGSYEQDNDISNGKESIEWLVLSKKNNKLLLISKYALDCQPYNTTKTDVTWETCSLRKWLNNDFLNEAFTAKEKAMIPTVTVSADINPDYNTYQGSDTQDKLFLLSVIEAKKYFTTDYTRTCEPTAYASTKGVTGWWHLRTIGFYDYYSTEVNTYGVTNSRGSNADNEYAVRPALWIDLNAFTD